MLADAKAAFASGARELSGGLEASARAGMNMLEVDTDVGERVFELNLGEHQHRL